MSGKLFKGLVLFPLFCFCCSGQPLEDQIPVDVRHVLECILPTEGFGRRFLRLPRNATAQFRFLVGGIPRTSEAESSAKIVNVVLYNRNGTRAIISLAYFKGPRVEISQMPYFLKKTRNGWEVLDGEGGLGTYDAVVDFVSGLDAKPLISIRLSPAQHDWCDELPL